MVGRDTALTGSETAKVVVMPGVERRDMAGAHCDSQTVLQSAIDAGVTDAIVIGRDRAGNLYVASSSQDVDKSVAMLMRAVALLV